MKKVLRTLLGAPQNSFTASIKMLMMAAVLLFSNNMVNAQIIDENFETAAWHTAIAAPGNNGSASGQVVITALTSSTTVTYYTVQNNTQTSSSINTTPNSGTWWYSRASSSSDTRMNKIRSLTHSMQLAGAGYIITPITKTAFVSVTFWAALASPMVVGINTNTDAVQTSFNSNATNTATALNQAGFTYASQTFSQAGVGSSMTSYNFTGTFSGPARIGFFSIGSSTIYIDDITVTQPSGTPPVVVTNSITPAKNSATINGTVTPGTMPLNYSGVIWSTSNSPMDTSLSTKTKNTPSATGPYNNQATGLNTSTNYFGRAYVVDLVGNVYYGAIIPFTTLAPTIPVLTTTAVSNILSNKATSGGNISDSGGTNINVRGVCWSTTVNPTIANSRTNDGMFGGSFVSQLAGLSPSTTYYVRAYATNSVGTAYGNQVTFTTAAPTPIITATPSSLAFGGIAPGTTTQQSYILAGSILSPASGNLTVTAPAGYQVSLLSGSGFANSISVPYTGSTLAPTTIFVRFTPTQFGDFNGTITHSGGGAVAPNVEHVTITGKGIQAPGDFSNQGTDFWTGYACHEGMYSSSTAISSSGGSQTMLLYLSSQQNAVVNIEIPGLGWTSGPIAVTANAVTTYTIPKGQIAGQYPALWQEGKFNKAIHITSDIPVVAYAHIYDNYVSAATLLLPVRTWGIEYNAISYAQQSSANSTSFNFFFIVAKEDNTQIEITPSAPTRGGWAAGSVNSVTLNRGEVYNVLGAQGTDFTGSYVKSLSCDKPIAMFSGSGRTQVAPCSGTSSDNLFQQVFPRAAWGTKYLTTRLEGTVPNSIYRICVSNPATVVKVNGNTLPSAAYPTAVLVNNFYYEFEDSIPASITADKPVMVVQYGKSSNGCINPDPNATKGQYNGDPEMIIVSPIEQAIEKAVLYCSPNQTISFHNINVIIPTTGVSSFTLDGVNKASKFVVHPQDPTYSTAWLTNADGVTAGQHEIKSAQGFTAIVYGWGDNNSSASSAPRESYGYNAGTNIKDLNTGLNVSNPFPNTSGNTAPVTCLNNTFKFSITLPYKANSLEWDFQNNPNLTPNATVIQNPAMPADSTLKDGKWLYIFSIPTNYTFSAVGTYNVNVKANNTTADGCPGLRTIPLSVLVVDQPKADFTTAYNGCPTNPVNFTDASNGFGSPITRWNWSFGDGGTATTKNTSRVYAAPGNYNVTLRAISDIGCFHDTVKVVTINALPTASFTAVRDTTCVNTNVVLTPTTNTPVGTITNWNWNYGDGTTENATVGTPRTKAYANPGTYTVTLSVTSSAGCTSTVFTRNIVVYRTTADFTFSAASCANVPIVFTDASTGGGGPVNNWLWNFGTSTSTIQNPSFTFTAPGTFNVSLQVVSNRGCTATVTKPVIIQSPLPSPVVTSSNITATSITFQWTSIAGAVGYAVSLDGTNFVIPSSGTTGTTHTVSGLQPNASVTITVRAIGTNACQNSIGTATARTLLPDVGVFVPNTFTPNGDGKNDVIRVYSNYISTIQMKVFNQWGELIFTSTNPAMAWDGTSKGKIQPVGVYIYVLNATMQDGSVINKKGSINLIR